MSSSRSCAVALPIVAFAFAACAPQEPAAPPPTPEPTPTGLSVAMSTELDATAADVWNVVGDFGGIDRFMDDIASVELEGEGVGAVRTLHLADGAEVVETLDAWDAAAMSYSYSIDESPLPIADYSATMTVSALEDGRSKVDWESTFVAAGVSDEEARETVADIYEMGFAGLKKRFSDEAAEEESAAE